MVNKVKETKWCKYCEDNVPIEDFGLNPYVRVDGERTRSNKCKKCANKYVRSWQDENKAKRKERLDEWKEKHGGKNKS